METTTLLEASLINSTTSDAVTEAWMPEASAEPLVAARVAARVAVILAIADFVAFKFAFLRALQAEGLFAAVARAVCATTAARAAASALLVSAFLMPREY